MRCTLPVCVTVLFVFPIFVTAQSASPRNDSFAVSPDTRATVRLMIGDSTLNGQAYEYDGHLADMIGPRLTGSSNYMRAADWAGQQFKALGLKNVHTEEWTIPATWEPEKPAGGQITEPVHHLLHIYSLGWAPSVSQGIEGEVVYVPSFAPDALDAQKEKLAGKIVLVDPSSYGEKPSLDRILSGFDRLHSIGPLAILTTGIANGGESLTALTFNGVISAIPEAEVGLEDSLLIKRLLERGPVTVQFSLTNTIRKNVQIPNVIGEITGSELPNEVVLVGAHLDSWQAGTGAQDNGTGVAGMLEAARAIQALSRPPLRTVRFVLFGGEEEGLLGSSAYVRRHAAEMPQIDAILISDTGSAPAKGWYVMGREDEKVALQALTPLLVNVGAEGVSSDTSGIFQTDHAAFDVLGVPTLVLWNDMEKYGTLHHKASDTFDSVVQKDLVQGALVTAITAYAIADSKSAFGAHLSPAEVQSMLEKAGRLDTYKYLHSGGALP
jgi:carboxypeptidase Q